MPTRVTSREYKIMLRAERFAGEEQQVLEAATGFWSDFENAVRASVIDTDKTLDRIKRRRTVRFLDTADHRLRENGYVFRERSDRNGSEVTLKFRHPDRYLAQDRDMDSAGPGRSRTKLEEDLKPTFKRTPFVSLFSYSTTQEVNADQPFETLRDCAKLFPDLPRQLADAYRKDDSIETVGFAARELVVTGADFQIGQDPKLECECALVAWYREDRDVDGPVFAEFSFKYGDDKEKYKGEPAWRACEVFRALQQMDTWVDDVARTKTAGVYEAAGTSRSGVDF